MQRTKRNIRDSDATLIISLTANLTGGSLFTYKYANKMNKPCLHIYPAIQQDRLVQLFMKDYLVKILNIAGPSNATEIEEFVFEVLDQIL